MGLFDGLKNKKLAKNQEMAEKARQLVSDTNDLMKTVESPFAEARKNISDYEIQVKIKPAKAYKAAYKAYMSAVSESEAAKRFTEAMETLENQKKQDESKVKGLEAKYRSNIASGNTKKALEIANEMYSLASKNPDPTPVKVSLDESQIKIGEIDIVVNNKETSPIIINAIACRSGSQQVYVEESLTEVVPAGSQISRVVTFDSNMNLDMVVYIDYEMGFEHYNLKKTFNIRKEM